MGRKEQILAYCMSAMAISIALFIAGVIAMRYVIIHMPANYFVRDGHEDGRWIDHHPAVRWLLISLKNILGAGFLLVGGLMIFTPGPGIMLLLLGLALVDLPGKRRVELWLLSFPKVRRQINNLRCRHGQPPLEMPQEYNGEVQP